jgi:hypothetical protein
LSGIETELKPKGFEVVEGAVNENPDVPGFMRRFNPPFPVGTAPGQGALDFLQWPNDQRPLVPLMVFIDRQGMIRAQYSGLDEKFFDDNQEQHLREEALKLLNEPPEKPKAKRAGK